MEKQRCLTVALAVLLMSSSTALAKNGDVKSEGVLTGFSSTSATVAGLTCDINGQTEFENSNGVHIAPGEFAVGDRVELKCINSNGTLVARELELQQEMSPGGSSSPSPSASPSLKGDDGDKHSRRGHSRSQDVRQDRQLRLRARLVHVAGSNARGKLDYRKSRKESRLTMRVHIPIPSDVPSINDRNEALSTPVEALLSRESVPYALCQLSLDDHDDDEVNDLLGAEFKLTIRQRIDRDALMKRGTCDIDLESDGIQSGIPEIQAGDAVAVRVEGGTAFLEGTVRSK